MEAQGTIQQSLSGSSAKVFCKCGEGWSCAITRTVGPDAGKTFVKCGGGCTCVVEADGRVSQQELKVGEDKEKVEAYCECGEGWSCVISKIEAGHDKPKPYVDSCAHKSCCTTTTTA